ncbi:MAG: pilus assembly protein PilM [Phycisphaerales bacterium]|jgi:Tfp pilus assembly PilM family ATPase
MGKFKMLDFLKNHAYSIGVDISDDGLKLVQLKDNGNGISLVAGSSENLPKNVEAGSSKWQRWAINALRKLTSNGDFQGKEVIAAMPTSELFIDYVKMPKIENHKLEDTVFSKIKQKLPFEPVKENIMMQYIPMENDNLLVIAAERKIIDRHLAIYEEAGLSIKSIGVWPMAMANCYTKFFGRRKSDHDSIVMLVCIETNYTNVVMCRHKNLLFARSISIGLSQLDNKKTLNRLILELTACRRQFASMYQKANIERLIFLSGNTVDREICMDIAKQLEMPAQVGDCLAATEITNPNQLDTESKGDKNSSGKSIDRRNCRVNWTISFGLSLS